MTMARQWRTIEEIDAEARGLGAVTKIVHSVKMRAWSCSEGYYNRPQPLSDHYFNSSGLEIAYCIRDLLDAGCGLHILPQPRVWNDYFLSLDTNICVELSAPAAAG